MESFYMTIIAIAAIILILALTYVGILLYYTTATDVFPPTPASACPDYWQVDGSGCIFPRNSSSRNRGSLATTNSPTTGNSPAGSDDIIDISKEQLGTLVDNNAAGVTQGSKLYTDDNLWKNKYGKSSALCNKKYWATMNQISWDGVTNSNQC